MIPVLRDSPQIRQRRGLLRAWKPVGLRCAPVVRRLSMRFRVGIPRRPRSPIYPMRKCMKFSLADLRRGRKSRREGVWLRRAANGRACGAQRRRTRKRCCGSFGIARYEMQWKGIDGGPADYGAIHRQTAQDAQPDPGAVGRAAGRVEQDPFEMGDGQVHAGLRRGRAPVRRVGHYRRRAAGRAGGQNRLRRHLPKTGAWSTFCAVPRNWSGKGRS